MTPYVLVGGAWLGGWCWQSVARQLRDNGHDAYPVTLTGLGERVHLASPEVDLDTHITDVVNLIKFEDLHNVVLLGHSYASLVVTGAADQIPDRIAQLVYLDTGPLPDGTVLIETFPTEARRHIEKQVEELGDGWRFPMPPWDELANMASLEGIDDAHLKLLRSRAVAQPFGTYTQPLRLDNRAREDLPKLGILCSFSLDQVQEMIASDTPYFGDSPAPTGGSSSYPRDTGPCSPGPTTSPSCSSIFHRTRSSETMPQVGLSFHLYERECSQGGKYGASTRRPASSLRFSNILRTSSFLFSSRLMFLWRSHITCSQRRCFSLSSISSPTGAAQTSHKHH